MGTTETFESYRLIYAGRLVSRDSIDDPLLAIAML